MYMKGIKCINLAMEIQGVENSDLAVPVNDTSKQIDGVLRL